MKWNLVQDKITSYCRLMRIDQPIGTLLLLWPTMWALWLSTPGIPSYSILMIFVMGVWLMRTAGCVINDYFDRKFDGHVKRTANRPLPSGRVSKEETLVIFIILVLISFFLVLNLNIMTILLSIVAIMTSMIYPLTKRYINLPQLILGIAFSWSIPMVYATVQESLKSKCCWLMFLANTIWTIAYDTQYAMVDRDDDIKIGIRSTAILFGHHDKLIIGILQLTMLSLLVIIGYISNLKWEFYCAVIITGLIFAHQQRLIFNRNRESFLKAFMTNNYVGLVLFLGLAISYR